LGIIQKGEQKLEQEISRNKVNVDPVTAGIGKFGDFDLFSDSGDDSDESDDEEDEEDEKEESDLKNRSINQNESEVYDINNPHSRESFQTQGRPSVHRDSMLNRNNY
jgi:hypothetical protein